MVADTKKGASDVTKPTSAAKNELDIHPKQVAPNKDGAKTARSGEKTLLQSLLVQKKVEEPHQIDDKAILEATRKLQSDPHKTSLNTAEKSDQPVRMLNLPPLWRSQAQNEFT